MQQHHTTNTPEESISITSTEARRFCGGDAIGGVEDVVVLGNFLFLPLVCGGCGCVLAVFAEGGLGLLISIGVVS